MIQRLYTSVVLARHGSKLRGVVVAVLLGLAYSSLG